MHFQIKLCRNMTIYTGVKISDTKQQQQQQNTNGYTLCVCARVERGSSQNITNTILFNII